MQQKTFWALMLILLTAADQLACANARHVHFASGGSGAFVVVFGDGLVDFLNPKTFESMKRISNLNLISKLHNEQLEHKVKDWIAYHQQANRPRPADSLHSQKPLVAPQVFEVAHGSSSSQFDQGSVDSITETANSITCTSRQRVSNLFANLAITLSNDIGADVIVEVRLRKASATDSQATDTSLYTTFAVGYDSGNVQQEAGESTQSSVVCERGERLLLEIRLSSPNGSGLVFVTVGVSASVEATELSVVPLASGDANDVVLAALGATTSGFVTAFGRSSAAVEDVSGISEFVETRYSWACPRNGTVDTLEVSGLLSSDSPLTASIDAAFVVRRAPAVQGTFADTALQASTSVVFSSATQSSFSVHSSTADAFECVVGDRIVLQARFASPGSEDPITVHAGFGASLHFF